MQQGIYFQNTLTAQYQKNKQFNKKISRGPK